MFEPVRGPAKKCGLVFYFYEGLKTHLKIESTESPRAWLLAAQGRKETLGGSSSSGREGFHLLKEKEPEISAGCFFVLSLKIYGWIINSKAAHGWGESRRFP